jgi:hypothetical protein
MENMKRTAGAGRNHLIVETSTSLGIGANQSVDIAGRKDAGIPGAEGSKNSIIFKQKRVLLVALSFSYTQAMPLHLFQFIITRVAILKPHFIIQPISCEMKDIPLNGVTRKALPVIIYFY